MGKSTISMAIFNSYVSLPEGNLLMNVAMMSLPVSGLANQNYWPLMKKLGFKHLGVNDYSSSGVIKRPFLLFGDY